MGAPIMQPPSSNVKIRKSIRLNDTPETEVRHILITNLIYTCVLFSSLN